MIKSYISLNSLHLTTSITINDIPVVVEFTGGRLSPSRLNGRFVTDSELIQKALEKDINFNKEFALMEDEQKNNKKQPKTAVENLYINVPEVKNRQMAIEWIAENLDTELTKNMSQSTIKKYVNKYGYNFSEWR